MSGVVLGRRALLLAALACGGLAASGVAAPRRSRVKARDVSIATPDGQAQAALFEPEGKGRRPALILWHDLGGLQPLYRDIGRDLAAQGFLVLVPNAYYRSTPPVDANVDINQPDVRKQLMTYREAATDEGIARDATAYAAFLAALPSVRRGKIGSVGFDVGGAYAIRAAAALPDRVGVVGSIYGLGIATARPNSPHLLIPRTRAAYLIAISRDDDAREPQDTIDLRAALRDGGLAGRVDVQPANHGWAVPGSKASDPVIAAKVNSDLVSLLRASLAD